MKVIFLKDTKWGKKYETKELARGFAINYLLPNSIVSIFRESLEQKMLKEKKEEEEKIELLIKQALEDQKNIKKMNLVIKLSLAKDDVGFSYGSIGSKEIVNEIKRITGISLLAKQLVDFHSFKTTGDHTIIVRHYGEIISKIKVEII